jgi:hypothetical protein
MKCPTPCIGCDEVVELHRMQNTVSGLVCEECVCEACGGNGRCSECILGEDEFDEGENCTYCKGTDVCQYCQGQGFGFWKFEES